MAGRETTIDGPFRQAHIEGLLTREHAVLGCGKAVALFRGLHTEMKAGGDDTRSAPAPK